MFDTKETCTDCDNTYCSKCAETELITCEYCDNEYCTACLKEHTPDCKEEYDADNVEEEDEEKEGIYFNSAKTICILDIDNYSLTDFIEELSTLDKEFVLNEKLSDDKNLVWFKKQ